MLPHELATYLTEYIANLRTRTDLPADWKLSVALTVRDQSTPAVDYTVHCGDWVHPKHNGAESFYETDKNLDTLAAKFESWALEKHAIIHRLGCPSCGHCEASNAD